MSRSASVSPAMPPPAMMKVYWERIDWRSTIVACRGTLPGSAGAATDRAAKGSRAPRREYRILDRFLRDIGGYPWGSSNKAPKGRSGPPLVENKSTTSPPGRSTRVIQPGPFNPGPSNLHSPASMPVRWGYPIGQQRGQCYCSVALARISPPSRSMSTGEVGITHQDHTILRLVSPL